MTDSKEIHQLEVPDLFFGLLFIPSVVICAFPNIMEDCTFMPYESWKGKRYIRIENHESLKSLINGFWWLFNFFRVDGGVPKEINHRRRGEHRELLFSVSSVLSVVFPEPISEDTKKSQALFGSGDF